MAGGVANPSVCHPGSQLSRVLSIRKPQAVTAAKPLHKGAFIAVSLYALPREGAGYM